MMTCLTSPPCPIHPQLHIAEVRSCFKNGVHPWRADVTVELGPSFDAQKIDDLLEHVESDCVNTGEQVCLACLAQPPLPNTPVPIAHCKATPLLRSLVSRAI